MGRAQDGTQKRRSTLIDGVRGLAILLVVVGHTSQGMSSRGLWGNPSAATRLDAWMYSFHMPAFFFMSGLFVLGSLQKRGLRVFLQDRASALLWPYALFEAANTVLFRIGAHFTHRPQPPWHTVAWTFFTAVGAWFLPTLFFALAVLALLIRVPLPLLLIVSLVVRQYCLALPINFAAAGLFFLPMVVLGAIVGMRVKYVEHVAKPVAALAALLLAWATWLASGRFWQLNYFGSLGLALAGTLMLLLLARSLDETWMGRWLAWCGEASLGIFLLAPYAQVAMRTLLLRLHASGSAIQLALPSLAAVLFGAWVYHSRDRLHVPFLFQFPRATDSR